MSMFVPRRFSEPPRHEHGPSQNCWNRQPLERLLEELPGGCIARLQLHGELQMLDGRGPLAVLQKEIAQHPMNVGQVWLAAQGGSKRLDGPRPVPYQNQAMAEVVVSKCKIGF